MKQRTAGGTHPARSNPHLAALLETSRHACLPELFVRQPDEAVLYRPNRHGVSVVALRTSDLTEEQLVKLLTYQLTQYVLSGLVEPHIVNSRHIAHELAAEEAPDDVHILAGAADTGELLCCVALRAVAGAAPGLTLRSVDRSLLHLEEAFGWGIFNRLPILPDLPLQRIRELDAFVKNQQLSPWNELAARAPIEVTAALVALLRGPLALDVSACVADIEDGVATKNLAYFHIPVVLLRGVMPCVPEDSPFAALYQDQARYPIAFLSSDLVATSSRLAAIEQALALPGKHGLRAVLALRGDTQMPASTLAPRASLEPPDIGALDYRALSLADRRRVHELGDWLRTTEPFGAIGIAEAAMLAQLCERCSADAGAVILRQDDPADALFVLQTGHAVARLADQAPPRTVEHLGPGSVFGEIALLTGGRRTADVVATTPVALLRVSREAARAYLATAPDVEQRLLRTALRRLAALRHTART